MLGGSAPGKPGNAAGNIVTNLDIRGAPGDGILLYDTSDSTFEDFSMSGLGMTRLASAIQNLNTGLGAASQRNAFQSGHRLSYIDGGTLSSDYYDDSLQTSASITHVWLESTVLPNQPIQERVDEVPGPCSDRVTVSQTLGPGSALAAPTPILPTGTSTLNPFYSPVVVSITSETPWALSTCGFTYTSGKVPLHARAAYTFYYSGTPQWSWTTP
jgi:hypothetical protein